MQHVKQQQYAITGWLSI